MQNKKILLEDEEEKTSLLTEEIKNLLKDLKTDHNNPSRFNRQNKFKTRNKRRINLLTNLLSFLFSDSSQSV